MFASQPHRSLNTLRSLLIAILLAAPWLTPASAQSVPLSFTRDVLPVFDKYCNECHSGWFPDGGLRLNTLENIREGGRSGAAVIPGKPGKGWVPYGLNIDRGCYRMPPAPASIV